MVLCTPRGLLKNEWPDEIEYNIKYSPFRRGVYSAAIERKLFAKTTERKSKPPRTHGESESISDVNARRVR